MGNFLVSKHRHLFKDAHSNNADLPLFSSLRHSKFEQKIFKRFRMDNFGVEIGGGGGGFLRVERNHLFVRSFCISVLSHSIHLTSGICVSKCFLFCLK